MNIRLVAAGMLAAATACGCTTNSSFRQARPPSGPLNVEATWSDIEKAKMEKFYGDKSSYEVVRSPYDQALVIAVASAGAPTRSLAAPVCSTGPGVNAGSNCAQATPSKPQSDPGLKKYQELGLMLAELHCNAYLTALETAASHQAFARETTSDAGTAASAMLALLKNATNVVAVTTASFSFAESFFKNYQQAYLPSDEIGKGKGLFQKARLALLENFASNAPESLAIATYRIKFYSGTCTQEWTKRLLAAAAEKATKDDVTSILSLTGMEIEAGAQSASQQESKPESSLLGKSKANSVPKDK